MQERHNNGKGSPKADKHTLHYFFCFKILGP